MRVTTSVLALIASLVLAGCGASPGPAAAEPSETTSTDEDRAAPTELDQLALDGIRAALVTRLGFPVRVVGHIADGDGQLVVYTMNGLSHWLALRPDREALAREIQACEDAGGSEPQSCADVTLRGLRGETQFREYVARCMEHVPPDEPTGQEHCENEASNMLVFDVEAYCDRGFWARARREGDAWTVTLAGAFPQLCLAELLSLTRADVNADGQADLLVDAVYSHVDSMRLTTDAHTRSLVRYDATTTEPIMRGRPIPLATYPADLAGAFDLRCQYNVLDGNRTGIELECCLEPTEDPPPDTPEGEQRHFATWPPNEQCSAHWTEWHVPVPDGGFAHCWLEVAADDTPIRAEPNANGAVIDSVYAGMQVRQVGERGDWIELLYSENQRGWILRSETREDCPSP